MFTQLSGTWLTRRKMAASFVGSDKTSIQAKLQDNLAEFGSLIRQLVESFAGSGKPTQDMQVVQEILQKMLLRDKEIQSLADAAVKMCRVEVEVVGVKEELAVRRLQIVRLQSRLRDAEKILEVGVYKGRQKLQAIEQTEKGAVGQEDLIRYAHHISQASSVVSPVGWKLSDHQRPFPHDIEMRCGFLGELTSGVKHAPSDLPKDGKMPEKKPFLEGGVLPKDPTSLRQTQPVDKAAPDPEVMSEDSSASSDEGS